MSAEDRLRDLLRNEAVTIVPDGDGLVRIRERIARRRRVRFWVLPSAAVAAAAAAAAFFVFGPDDLHKTQTLTPATQSPSASAAPTPSSSPLPVVPDDGGMPLDVPAIWPFTSAGDAAGWQTTYPYAQNGLQVGTRFVDGFLGLKGVTVSQPCVSCGVLRLAVGGVHIGDITLARFGTGFAGGHGTQLYTVAGVGGLDLTITSPTAGARITSPTPVEGRAGQVDENVALRLLSQAGDELASTTAPAGRDVPWTASLSWSRQDWTHGGIVGVTRSAKDGAITRLVAVPVLRGTTASGSSSATAFAGVVDGHVALFDSASGRQVRQLTFPPSGKADTQAAWSNGTLAWVRTAGASACVNELDRLVAGKASTLVKSTSALLASPRLSPDAAVLAYSRQACQGGAEQIVVHAAGAPDRVVMAGAGTSVVDVRNDGSVLIWVPPSTSGSGTLHLSRPEDGTAVGSTAFVADHGCAPTPAASFVDGGIVAFEDCNGTVRLVHVGADNRIASRDRAIATEAPQSLSARNGAFLAQLFGGDTYGAIATYADGSFHTLVTNASSDCTSTGSGKGCVAGPDW